MCPCSGRSRSCGGFSGERGEACWHELEAKWIDAARADELTAQLATAWPATRARIRGVTLGPVRMAEVLAAQRPDRSE